MGPEPILGVLGLLGFGLIAGLALFLRARPHLWPYVLFSVLPGIALALEGSHGQVGVARNIGVFMGFFAIGTVAVGVPVAGLGWWWRNRLASRSGTLE